MRSRLGARNPQSSARIAATKTSSAIVSTGRGIVNVRQQPADNLTFTGDDNTVTKLSGSMVTSISDQGSGNSVING